MLFNLGDKGHESGDKVLRMCGISSTFASDFRNPTTNDQRPSTGHRGFIGVLSWFPTIQNEPLNSLNP